MFYPNKFLLPRVLIPVITWSVWGDLFTFQKANVIHVGSVNEFMFHRHVRMMTTIPKLSHRSTDYDTPGGRTKWMQTAWEKTTYPADLWLWVPWEHCLGATWRHSLLQWGQGPKYLRKCNDKPLISDHTKWVAGTTGALLGKNKFQFYRKLVQNEHDGIT